MGKIARETGTVVVASRVRAARGGRVSQHGGGASTPTATLVGIYRKMHIPDDPLYYEKFYFTPGDLGFRDFDTAYGRIGVLVCWDQWYPEAARLTAMQGAEVLFYPTAIGWHPAGEGAARERRNSMPGGRSSAGTPSPTECTWRR